MPDAAYFRAWRAAHPEYRARQNLLRNARRRVTGRGDRSAEYARRASRAIPEIPELHLGHQLFDRARNVVGPRTTSFVTLFDPLYDDLVSEATLAIIEGRDPSDAVRAYRARERGFERVTCQLLDEAA